MKPSLLKTILLNIFCVYTICSLAQNTARGFYMDGKKVDTLECFGFGKLEVAIPFQFSPQYDDYIVIGIYGKIDGPIGPLKSFSGEWLAAEAFQQILDKETISSAYYKNGYFVYDVFQKNNQDANGFYGKTYQEDCVNSMTAFDILTRARLKYYKENATGMLCVTIMGRKLTSYCRYTNPATLEKTSRAIYTNYPLQREYTCVYLNGKGREKLGKFAFFANNKSVAYSSDCTCNGMSIDEAIGKSVLKGSSVVDKKTPGNSSSKVNSSSSGLNGPFVKKFGNGATQSEGSYTNGVPSGTWKIYSVTGVLMEKIEYGTTEGDRTITYYTDSGPKYEERTYVNNKLSGKKIRYYPDGKLESSETYINGEKNGEEIYMSSDGVKEVTTYKSETKHGSYKKYDKEGKLEKEGNYSEGMQDGTWKYYEKGLIKKTEKWNKGELIQ